MFCLVIWKKGKIEIIYCYFQDQLQLNSTDALVLQVFWYQIFKQYNLISDFEISISNR